MSLHDRWGGARTGDGRRFEVRWRQAGKQHKRRFTSKPAAVRFDAARKLDPDAPARRSTWTVEEMCAAWLKSVAVKPATMRAYELEVAHINKAFGDRLASQVKPSEVRAWLARSEPGVSIRRRCLVTLRRAYTLAILDKAVLSDPTVGAKPPKWEQKPPQFLTWQALDHLAQCAGKDAPLIWLLGTGGLRLSEAVALDQEDVDRARGRVLIRRSKTDAGVREVPLSPGVMEMLPTYPGPVFKGQNGGRLNKENWRNRRFNEIREAAGLSEAFTPHKLRHTAASLAIASGADAKTVALMLGHTDASISLNIYSHRFEQHLDAVATRMDAARQEALSEPTKRPALSQSVSISSATVPPLLR